MLNIPEDVYQRMTEFTCECQNLTYKPMAYTETIKCDECGRLMYNNGDFFCLVRKIVMCIDCKEEYPGKGKKHECKEKSS